MAIINDLGKNIEDVIKFILTNEDIKKLLTNNNETALTEPLSTLPIKEYDGKHTFDILKMPNVQDEVKTFICVDFFDAQKAGNNNTYQYTATMFVDIITHETTWRLEGSEKRAYKIADLIDTSFKDLKTNSIKGEFTFRELKSVFYDSDGSWRGKRLVYTVTGSSLDCEN